MTRETFWTPGRQAEFRDLVADGKKKPELATHFGVSTNAINGQMFRQGLTKPNARRGKHAAKETAE